MLQNIISILDRNKKKLLGNTMLASNSKISLDFISKSWYWHGFGASTEPTDKEFDKAVFVITKTKQFNNYVAQKLLSICIELYIVGENKSGIDTSVKSITKTLQDLGINVCANKVDSRKHSSLWHIKINKVLDGIEINSIIQINSYSIMDANIKIASLPGIFSFNRLDIGTKLLIETIFTHNILKNANTVLDYGCGCGVIGAFLKSKYPGIQLFMNDYSAFAVLCTKKTLEINSIQANVCLSDNVLSVLQTYKLNHIDSIISNPPFHDDINIRYGTTKNLIKDASSVLSDMNVGGLTIVANSHLNYYKQLEANFTHYSLLSSTNTFKVHHACN